ncbi:MAG: hypothetical protein AB8B69_23955, partial [Chitinophagales bacterium]
MKEFLKISLLPLLCLFLTSNVLLQAQTCNIGAQDIVIADQIDIDNFQLFLQANFGTTGTCTNLVFDDGFGLVVIDSGVFGPDITDLNGLSDLVSVDGYFVVLYTGIANVFGLSNLVSVSGDFVFLENIDLVDLSDLSTLQTVGGDLDITSNFSLPDLTGLETLQSVGGTFFLEENFSVTDISALSTSLTSVGSLFIFLMDGLTSLAGLENLTTITGDVFIETNLLLDD